MGLEQTHEDCRISIVQDGQDLESSVETGPHNGSTDQRDASMASEHGTACQAEESANVQSHQLTPVSNPRPIAVVIPARSHSSVTPQPPDQPDRASRILEDDDVSDSVPSDDENEADYTENNETQEAEEQLPPVKVA